MSSDISSSGAGGEGGVGATGAGAEGGVGATGAAAQLSDPGAARNTLLQLCAQVISLACTAGLTLYLVRALGARGYGVYALATSISGLLLYPAYLGLPLAIGRFLADHLGDLQQLRSILRLGLRLQVSVAALVGLALFAAAGLVAHLYGARHLAWPLRWAAVALTGQAVFALLSSAGTSLRRVSVTLFMTIAESITETGCGVLLVVLGAGAAGAMLGKAAGYAAACVIGTYLAFRLLGRSRAGSREPPRQLALGRLTRYAGVMFLVEVSWSAITQIDVILIGLLLSTVAVGSFGAVMRIITILGYLGTAMAAGVAPRLSLAAGSPDVAAFERGLRYLIIVQAAAIAPLVVWATPIVGLLLGPHYPKADQIMRLLAPYALLSGPAALVTLGISYLGEARRRVPVMLSTLALGVVSTYVLLKAIGLLGAALADDVVELAYVLANLWLFVGMVHMPVGRLGLCMLRSLLGAGAMAGVLYLFGTGHLAIWQWVGGAIAALLAYLSVLLLSREVKPAELRMAWGGIRGRLLPG